MRKGKGTKSSESLFLLPMKEKQKPYYLLCVGIVQKSCSRSTRRLSALSTCLCNQQVVYCPQDSAWKQTRLKL